jgi:hypothetical protein
MPALRNRPNPAPLIRSLLLCGAELRARLVCETGYPPSASAGRYPPLMALSPVRTARIVSRSIYPVAITASTVTAAQQIMPANQASERTTGILNQ